MTGKQIIVDGVDVAKCRNFISEWDFNNCGHICKGTECKYKRLWYKKQLKHKEQECEKLRRSITKIFACLIKANRGGKIIDTLWVDGITTLWDYIALTLGIEGDQTQIEEQIHINPLITEEKPVNKYKQALDEIEEIAKYNNFLVRDPFCGTGYRDLSGQILSIIKRAKEK